MKHHILLCAVSMLFFNACQEDDAILATITTEDVTSITQISATSGGTISSNGGSNITSRGVCWSTSANPTINDPKTVDGTGTGTFISQITGLSAETKYYVRAYASNSTGTAYGQKIEFTTSNQTSTLLSELVSYWKMDENSGTSLADAIGTWDLTFVNNPVLTIGKVNNGLDCGTVSARYAEKNGGVNSGNKNTYTLAAWINLETSVADAKMIMGMNSGVNVNNAGAAEVKIYLSTDNYLVAAYHTEDGIVGPMQRISGTALSLNTWYHVAGVINNGTIDLYINGSIDNTNAVTNNKTSNLNFTNGRVTVGTARLFSGAYNTARWFRGKIDEAGIWARALSEAEIQQLYNNGNGMQYPF